MKKILLLIGIFITLFSSSSFAHSWGNKRVNCWGFISPRYIARAEIVYKYIMEEGVTYDQYGNPIPYIVWGSTKICDESAKGCNMPQNAYCEEYMYLYDYGYYAWYGANAGYRFTFDEPNGFIWAYWTNSYRLLPGVAKNHYVDSAKFAQLDKAGNSYCNVKADLIVDEETKTLHISNFTGQLSIQPNSNYFSTLKVLIIKQNTAMDEEASRRFDSLGDRLIFENVVASGEIMVSKDGIRTAGFLSEILPAIENPYINDTAFGIILDNISGIVNLDVDLEDGEALSIVTFSDGGFDYSLAELDFEVVRTMSKKFEQIAAQNYSAEIFPNPATGTINFEFDLASDSYILVDIYNINGQKISSVHNGILYSGKNSFKNIDISTLAPGTYFLKVVSRNTESVHKFSVQ